MYRKTFKWILILVLGIFVFAGSHQVEARRNSRLARIFKASIVVDSYEFGPGVSKIVLQSPDIIEDVRADSYTSVKTAGIDRQINDVYLSDSQGNLLDDDGSQYITLELEVSYNPVDPGQSASPFTFDLTTYKNLWVSSYVVNVSNLILETAETDNQRLSFEQDAVANRIIPTANIFSERGRSALPYAAYSPQSAAGGEKNPLIVWLHGVGEVGTDLSFPLLANEVVSLTEPDIQNHFTSTGKGSQTGAHVLVPQSPVSWTNDPSNPQNAETLMSTIQDYVASHPDVDPDRIYLSGASNGGAMTLAMGAKYPDYFAALIPIASPYSYQANGDSYSLDQNMLAAFKDQPMWLIHSASDATVPASSSALPFYKALIDSGARNKWISYFETSTGTDLPGLAYNGHWAWIYYFNNQVAGVQSVDNVSKMSGLTGLVATDPTQGGASKATVNGREYSNIFEWMNDQTNSK